MSTGNFFDFKAKNSQGEEVALSQFKGKAVLVVNVASQCGFTPQYAGLETIFKKYSDQGLVVLAFPCNQFGAQEPGDEKEIQQFCKLNYDVSFPVMAKVNVNGEQAAPVFEFLKSAAPGLLGTEAIKWNFTKFLVGKDGKVIDRFAPQTKPEELVKDVEKALKA